MANTRSQQTTLIANNLPDNTTQDITPQDLRDVLDDGVTASAFVDDTNAFTGDNSFAGVTSFTKKVKLHKGSNIASASTLNLGNTGNYFEITGSTNISGIQDGQAGTQVILRFQAALTLIHSASFFLPNNGTNIATAAGDFAFFVCQAANSWRCVSYQRANGAPVALPSVTMLKTGINTLEADFEMNSPLSGGASLTPVDEISGGFRDFKISAGPSGVIIIESPADILNPPFRVTVRKVPGTGENGILCQYGDGSGGWINIFEATSAGKIGFFGALPVVQPNGVSAADALNALGLGSGII